MTMRVFVQSSGIRENIMFKDQTDQIFEDIVETIHEPLLVLDYDLLVLSANRNFYDTFRVTPEETVGRLIYDLGNKQWDIPRLRTLLENIISKESKFDNYEVEHTFPDIGHKIMLLNARRILHKGIGAQLILLALEDITRRSQLESLLEDSEQRYRRLFETANDGILLLEKSAGNIAQANPAIMKMFGYSQEDYIGKKLENVGFPPDKGDIQEILHTLERDGIIYYNDAPIKTKAGKIIETDIYLVDRASLIQCNIRDITERKRAENKIHQISAIQNLILENSTLGIALVRNRVFEWVNERLGELLLLPVEQLQGFSTRVIYPSEEAYKELGKIAYPVIARGERSDNVLELQRSDGTLFWCRFLGKALNPAKPADGSIWMFEDITVSQQSAAALEESEKKYRELYDFLPIPVYEMDFEANITSANRAVYKSFRATKDDFRKGSKAWQLLSPEDIDKSRKNIERLLSGEKVTDTEYTLMRLDGSVFTAIVISSLIYSKDKPVGLRGAIVDITERKEAEASLKVSEERYKALFDRSLNPVFIHDFAGNFIDANQTALQLLGYDREDIPSLNFASLLDTGQLPEAFRTLDELRKTGSQKEFSEFNLKCKNGTYINMETRASVIYRDNKQHAILGIGRDITQRKRAEEALRLSEEKYRWVMDNMADVITVMDMNLRFTYVSPSIMRMRGYNAEEATAQTLEQVMTPESLRIVAEVFEEEMKLEASGTADPRRMRILELEQYRKDGSIVLMENSLSFMRDEAQNPVGIISVTRDITDRRQAENALKESE